MPGNAAIYVADPSMLGSRVFDTLESIEAYEGISDGNEAKGFVLRFGWGQCTCSIMSNDDFPDHMSDFENYVRNQPQTNDELVYVLSRLANVRMSLGMLLVHDEESEEAVYGFLFDFNSALNGLLFLHDTVWDWSGDALCGPHKNG